MNHARTSSYRRPQAQALESRVLLDAAVVATTAKVVAASDTKPGVSASAAEATVTINDSSGKQTVDLFSNVSVATDNTSHDLSNLVVTVSTSGSNQALVIDGTTIALTAGSGETADNHYVYSVSVSGGTTTITLSIASSTDGYTADGAAKLIDSISYATLDKTVETGNVTVTLSTLSDVDGDVATLDISATIAVTSDINVAPVLSDGSSLTVGDTYTIDDFSGHEVLYSSDGSHAYVASDSGDISVFSIDAAGRMTLVQQLSDVSGLGDVTSMAISSDGKSIYTISGNSTIVVLNLASDGTVTSTSTADSSYGNLTGNITVSDDGTKVYAGSQYDGTVIYTRDTTTGALTFLARSTDGTGRSGVITTSGDYVYIVYVGSPHALYVYSVTDSGLSLIDTLSMTTTGYSSVDYTLAASSDGSHLYIANPQSDTIEIYSFDGSTLTKVSSVPLSNIDSMALDNAHGVLYAVTSDGTLQVYKINTDGTLTATGSYATGTSGAGVSVSADGTSVLVAGGSVVRYTYVQTLDSDGTVTFGSGLTLSDSNNDALASGAGNYNGTTVTVTASVDSGTFGFAAGNGLTYSDGHLYLNGTEIATVTTSGTSVAVTFTADVSTAVANEVLQQLTYANASASAGSLVTLSVTINDGSLDSNTDQLVLRVNTAPQVDTDVSNGYTLAGATTETAYSYTLNSGLFKDADGDRLVWTVTGLPAGLTFDAATLTISGTTTATGTYSITISVTDTSGSTSATLALDLVVTQIADRAPTVNADASTALALAGQDTAYTATLDSSLFKDADSIYGDTLTWTVTGLPEGMTFDANTLTIAGTAAALGSYTLTVTATDGSGLSASTTLTLKVVTAGEASNSAPTLGVQDSGLTYTSEGGLTGYGYYVERIEVSDDGTSVMIVGSTGSNYGGTSYLSVYSRDTTTGALTLLQTFAQGTVSDGTAIDGLNTITSAVVSDDGSHVYVSGTGASGNYVVSIFSRDTTTGELTYVSSVSDVGGKVVEAALSNDGGELYVLTATTLYTYTVGSDGSLTLAGTFTQVGSSAIDLATSSNGTVYVLSSSGNITIYQADNGSEGLVYKGKMTLSSGALTWTDSDGTATSAGTSSTTELGSTFGSFAVTDDGYIYVATATSSRVTTLHYDSASNTLTYVTTLNPYSTLGSYPWAVTVSEDGTALYVGGSGGTVAVYAIGENGSLTLASKFAAGKPVTTITVGTDGTLYTGARYYNTGVQMIGTSATVTIAYTEGATIQPASTLTLADADYDALGDGAGNYSGATITITRSTGASTDDTFGLASGNGLTLTDGVVYLDGTAIATATSSGGTLTLTFTAAVTTATANQVLQQVTYTNTSNDPAASVSLTVTVSDAYTSASQTIGLTVTSVNDAPTLSSSGSTHSYATGDSDVTLFSGTTVDTIEAGQTISSLTLTVTGLLDGASESLTIGGSTVSLTNGNSVTGSIDVTTDGTTTSYSFTATVTVTDGTATVTITGTSLTSDAAAAIANSIGYGNDSTTMTSGTRTVTLTSIKDSGGTSNGGVDTTTLSVSATIAVEGPVNNAPTATGTAGTPTYTENGDAVGLFSGVTIATGDDGQAIAGITFTVSSLADGTSETLQLDGTSVTLTAGSGTTANGYAYTVTVDGDTATITVTSSAGMSTDAAATLVNGATYQNTSDDPTAGTRTVTLAAVQDTGGTANGGTDTVALTLAATVTVVAVNDAPVVGSTGIDASVSSGDSTSVFSGTTVSTVEAGQSVAAITLTVSGLQDGTDETLVVDGTTITLSEGNGTTTHGYAYTVSITDGVATLTLSSQDGIAATDAATTIDGIAYRNANAEPTAGVRTITLAAVQDTGGTANGGVDTVTVDRSASITVLATDTTTPVEPGGGDTPDTPDASPTGNAGTVLPGSYFTPHMPSMGADGAMSAAFADPFVSERLTDWRDPKLPSETASPNAATAAAAAMAKPAPGAAPVAIAIPASIEARTPASTPDLAYAPGAVAPVDLASIVGARNTLDVLQQRLVEQRDATDGTRPTDAARATAQANDVRQQADRAAPDAVRALAARLGVPAGDTPSLATAGKPALSRQVQAMTSVARLQDAEAFLRLLRADAAQDALARDAGLAADTPTTADASQTAAG